MNLWRARITQQSPLFPLERAVGNKAINVIYLSLLCIKYRCLEQPVSGFLSSKLHVGSQHHLDF